MFRPTKLLDIELSEPIEAAKNLTGYNFVQFLVRLHGAPIGYVKLPVVNDTCSAHAITRAVLQEHSYAVIRHLLKNQLMRESASAEVDAIDLIRNSYHTRSRSFLPLVSVAVCTRDNARFLNACMESLNGLAYPHLEILIVDNAPTSQETQKLVTERYPNMRYIREPRPGLNWARNRAILEASGDIIAYTDDDTVVDTLWINAIAEMFIEHPEVMAVTGLVVPHEMESEAQELFERYGGFGRGFERRWCRYHACDGKSSESLRGGTGKFGTGANMAYRRTLFERIGVFDPALDVGTVTNGGGDLEMFFRVLKEGYTLVYEPCAIVRHRHRPDYESLCTQISNWGIGFFAYLVRTALVYPDERIDISRLIIWWYKNKLRKVFDSFMYPNRFRKLHLTELKGSFKGFYRYFQARSDACKISGTCGTCGTFVGPNVRQPPAHRDVVNCRGGKAIRTTDVGKALQSLDDVAGYASVQLYVHHGGKPIGIAELPTLSQPISIIRIRDALVDHFGCKLFAPEHAIEFEALQGEMITSVKKHLLPAETTVELSCSALLPVDHTVSVIVATYDRPMELRDCLRSLMDQESRREVEIIVVDNNPSSGMTLPVTNHFPRVVRIEEQRKGLSYARNAGIMASRGDIVVTIDDDVYLPPGWLENLIRPFRRNDVMVVTGNVLPMNLETKAQRLFETYGGLGRGFRPMEADRKWFESYRRNAVPTWKLGATANAAFRSGIFSDPDIGFFDEALGAGTPAGCSEDTYMFYKVLKSGFTIIYEPRAYLFHKHRKTMNDLRNQIYNYSKGHAAYHVMTLINDHDLRSIVRLCLDVPRYQVKQLIRRLLGRIRYPLSLILLETTGIAAGPLALYRSRCRVRRLNAIHWSHSDSNSAARNR